MSHGFEISSSNHIFQLAVTSLGFALYGMILAAVRTLPYAMRLGRGLEDVETQNKLAIQVFYDHTTSLVGMVVAVVLQMVIAAA